MGEQDQPSNSELTALMQCALSGASRAALVDELVRGLQTWQDPASPKALLCVALRSARIDCVLLNVGQLFAAKLSAIWQLLAGCNCMLAASANADALSIMSHA